MDVATDEELKENLQSNPKIQFDGERYSYKVGEWLGGSVGWWVAGNLCGRARLQAGMHAGRQAGRLASRHAGS